MLGGLAIIGLAAIAYSIVVVIAITNTYGTKAAQNAELGQPFSISSAVRITKVGPLTIRHKNTAALESNKYKATLVITNSESHDSMIEINLKKGQDPSTSTTRVDGYLIELIDVSSEEASKLSLYKSTLKVSKVMSNND